MNDKKIDEAEVFNIARRIESSGARAEYLQQVCGDDDDLRMRVAQLLSTFDEQPCSLESESKSVDATLDMPMISEGPGMVVGPYKLLQQIGEGGFGVVYMAEQTHPIRRKVALKIIKPGMDTRQVVARFEAERQALALMDHQNIARVLDAGTTDSERPFFVMELVKGVPVTEYCDHNKLAPHERLELFIPICHAIQHAHQKGIIHRDIKPSNVLVCLYDGKPVPKVIDFGVAKAIEQSLTEKTMFTQHGQVIGTLEYMSPEQAELSQLDIDTRSDIYSLGVLLYELLTGTTPITKQQLRQAGFTEMLRLIREAEAEKPSTRLSLSLESLPTISAKRRSDPKKLSLLIQGELDWIVLKALEKDRTRRYDSASAFAADVQRHLNDETVEACPPSTVYRLQKLARRHRASLVTAAAFVVLLVVGICVSTWQAIRATRAESKAQRSAEVAIGNEKLWLDSAKKYNLAFLEAEQERAKAQLAEEKAKVSAEKAVASSEQAKDTLVRSLFEQARAVRLAEQGGHRWLALDLLRKSEILRNRNRQTSSTVSTGKNTINGADSFSLPTKDDLRSEAVATLLQSDGRVHQVWNGMYQSICPDGNMAAIYDIKFDRQPPEMTLRQVDLETGKDLNSWNRPELAGDVISLGPEGKLLASASMQGKRPTVLLWDLATGNLVKTLHTPAFTKPRSSVPELQPPRKIRPFPTSSNAEPKGNKPIRNSDIRKTVLNSSHSISADDQKQLEQSLSSKEQKPVIAKRPKSEREKRRNRQTTFKFAGSLKKLAFSPNGRYLGGIVSTGAETHVILWDLSKENQGKEIGSARGVPLQNLSFSGDRSLLAFPSGKNYVTVWDMQKQEPLKKIAVPMAEMIGLVSFSADGRLLAMNGYFEKDQSSATIIWDLERNHEQQRFTTRFRAFTALSFNPDTTRLAVADMQGRIVVFRLDEQREEFHLDHGSMPQLLFWRNDGKRLYSGGIGSLKEWELAVDLPMRVFRTADQSSIIQSQFDFSANGEWLALRGSRHTIRLHSWPTGTFNRSLKLTEIDGNVRFSPDSCKLVIHSSLGTIVMDAATGEELGRIAADAKYRTRLHSSAFTEQGQCLVVGTDQRRLTVWDVETGEPVWQTGKADKTKAVDAMLSPDGRMVATWESTLSLTPNSSSKEMVLWKLKSNQVIHRLPSDLATINVTFSPRSRWLAVESGGSLLSRLSGGLFRSTEKSESSVLGSKGDRKITLWNTQTGVQHLKISGQKVDAIAFSPHERLLALRYRNGAIHLWNVEQKERLFRWILPDQGVAVVAGKHLTFTADGRFLAASVGATGGIQLLDVRTIREQLQQMELGW